MTEQDWKRLSDFSGKANRYWDENARRYVDNPNQLYTASGGQIDTGFLKAKCIKHAFKTYPKIAIGKGTQLESEVLGEDNQPAGPSFDPYGGMACAPGAAPQEEKSFAAPAVTSAGVTVDPAAGGSDDVF